MAGKGTIKRDHRLLRRYLAGITVLSVFLAIIASQIAGATIQLTIYRALGVCACLVAAQIVVIRTWSAWDFVQNQHQSLRKRARKGA